jgi:hypothetical protein
MSPSGELVPNHSGGLGEENLHLTRPEKVYSLNVFIIVTLM